jgi:hypothetical protein
VFFLGAILGRLGLAPAAPDFAVQTDRPTLLVGGMGLPVCREFSTAQGENDDRFLYNAMADVGFPAA